MKKAPPSDANPSWFRTQPSQMSSAEFTGGESSREEFEDEFFEEEGQEVPVAEYYDTLPERERFEMLRADRLSVRLLAAHDDSLEEDQILEEALKLSEPTAAALRHSSKTNLHMSSMGSMASLRSTGRFRGILDSALEEQQKAQDRLQWMSAVALLLGVGVVIAVVYGAAAVIETRPPLQPVGPYRLVERQEGQSLLDAYTFYEGKDSVGSNGFNMYVDESTGKDLGIINVTLELDELDNVYYTEDETTTTMPDNGRRQRRRRTTQQSDTFAETHTNNITLPATSDATDNTEPFVYIGSAPSDAGPRSSIRLEGKSRFDRGLFILDVRHMPAGCGVWPAFWLVDEPNWPVNGEIDIVEGVNYQTKAKTALHSTRGCIMDDIPLGTMTGTWDTAQGIPDKKTGIPDMTLRYARNCFVYDPHQWLNQGCVAVDKKGGTIGVPLNENGGGVYVLEWDPINRHMRSWVFTPHTDVPENLVQAIRTANKDPGSRVMPDPDEWPVPYAYFAIGDGTNCAADHFKHMHLVINTAFCGSVAGNRYHLDCKEEQISEFPTCRDYVKSNPVEIQQEAYWKIRGVYVYERAWERTWIT